MRVEVAQECCRVGSSSCLLWNSNFKNQRMAKCWPRLPTHLAHPLKDNRAVVIHALGSSLQRSR
jgi:hypothetical protein